MCPQPRLSHFAQNGQTKGDKVCTCGKLGCFSARRSGCVLLAVAFVSCSCRGNLLPVAAGAAACWAVGRLIGDFLLDFSSAKGRGETQPTLSVPRLAICCLIVRRTEGWMCNGFCLGHAKGSCAGSEEPWVRARSRPSLGQIPLGPRPAE